MGSYDVNVATFMNKGFTIMYMVYGTGFFTSAKDAVTVKPTNLFDTFVKDTVRNYILNAVEPPTEISIAIRNMADDVVSGRDAVMRAGDYISLVTYAKRTGHI